MLFQFDLVILFKGLGYGTGAFGVVDWSDWDKRGVLGFHSLDIDWIFEAVAICHLRTLIKRLITIPFANGIIRAGSWRGSAEERKQEEKVDEQETYFLVSQIER